MAKSLLTGDSRKTRLANEKTYWAYNLIKNNPSISLLDKKDFDGYLGWKPDLVFKATHTKDGVESSVVIPVKYHWMNKSGGVLTKFRYLQIAMEHIHLLQSTEDVKVFPMMAIMGAGTRQLAKNLTDFSDKKVCGLVCSGFFVDKALMNFAKTGDTSGFFNHNFLLTKED